MILLKASFLGKTRFSFLTTELTKMIRFDILQPMSEEGWAWYTTETEKIAQQFPVDSEKVHSGDFNEWAAEGLQIAQDYVYNGKLSLFFVDLCYYLKVMSPLERSCLMSNFGGCFDTGFVENEDPSEEYRQRAEPVLKEHMMYAGRRLANLIMDIYAEDTQVEAPIAFLA